MARLEPLKIDEMSEDQKKIADEIIKSRGKVAGPFIPWLRNAELADSNKKLGAFCRFNTSLSPRLSEFIILIVARKWNIYLEWQVHRPLAIEAGMSTDVIEALRVKVVPLFVNKDEEIIYQFCCELLENKSVSDGLYDTALREFGAPKLVDIVAIVGYYCNVAITLNAFEIFPENGDEVFSQDN